MKAPSIHLLILIAFARCALCAIIPENRIYPWSNTVGVIGGIPVRTHVTNVTGLVGDGVTGDSAGINTYISNVVDNGIVQLPAGTFRLDKPLINTGTFRKGNFTLRGAGRGQTILFAEITATTNSGALMFGTGFYGPSIAVNRTALLLSDCAAKSTNLVLASAPASLGTNTLLYIDQTNDWEFVDSVGSSAQATFADLPRDGSRNLQNMVRVIQAEGGTNIQFWPPITFSAATNRSARVTVITEMVEGIGLEEFTLIIRTNDTSTDAMQLWGLLNCWMRGVEITNVPSHAVSLAQVLHFQAQSNYFHDIKGGAGTVGYGYGWDIRWSYGGLFEDNIMARLYAPAILSCGSAGNVWAYSTPIDVRNSTVTYQIASLSIAHGAHPHMNLIEGCVLPRIQADFNWGSSGGFTLFRNNIHGKGLLETNNLMCVSLDRQSWSNNVVGNVLGTAGVTWLYEPTASGYTANSNVIYRLGYPNIGNNTHSGVGTDTSNLDTNVAFTLLRHGNYNHSTGATIWDESISDHDLPASLYRSTAIPGARRWPLIGPDLTPMTISIPAEDRYNGVDPTSQRMNVGSGRAATMSVGSVRILQ